MFPLFNRTNKNENVEQFEVALVCPDRSLGLQIDGKKPPFRVQPVKPPSSQTEIKNGNILVGIDEWMFDHKTVIAEVLKTIREIMASDQPVIKLVLQREKGDRPKPIGPTWTCERCTVVNAMNHTTCDVCGLEQTESMTRLEGKLHSNWKCPSCTYENPSDKIKCGMCETERIERKESLNAHAMIAMSSDDQLKMAMERSMADDPNVNQNQDKGYFPTTHSPKCSAPPPDSYQMQAGNPVQYRQPGYCQYPPPQQPQYPPQQQLQPPQQYPYMQHVPQGMQQQLNPQGYMDAQVVPLQEPESAVQKEHTPEPEPKKLPRWQCGLCATSNEGDAVTCNTCNAPKISGQDEVRVGLEITNTAANVETGVQRRRQWKCTYCAYENSVLDGQCLMCSRTRSQQGNNEVAADPKEALDTVDRQKIAMAWLQKQLIVENRCRIAEFDAAFRRSDNRVTEAVFRLTSGFQNLDGFKGKLERFIRGQVGSLKRMGDQMGGRLQKVTNELQKVGKRYQETTEFLNITQLDLEEKIYLKTFTDKLDDLNGKEEHLRQKLEEIKAQKDSVTLRMRSEQINKKLQLVNCESVVKQLKEHMGFLSTEKNELDVQSEIIRQQVSNYEEMRRTLENVKLNDLKSTIQTFKPAKETPVYKQKRASSPPSVDVRSMKSSEGRKSYQQSPQLSPIPKSKPPVQPEDDILGFFSEYTRVEEPQSVIPTDESEKPEEKR